MTAAAPAARPDSAQPLLEIKSLVTEFKTDEGIVRAVDDVSFAIAPGETLGVVGESGCGKSVTALSVMRLVAEPPGRVASGQVLYRGQDLLRLAPEAMRAIRGNKISMIFQEPMTSLNPVFTVGDQIGEAIRLHQKKNRREARARSIDMLRTVGIPSPEQRVDSYPHQMSGGMRQRVMIAMALACNPDLLIADEPTTALDVTIQAQILDIMSRLQRERKMAIMLITHDLGVVAQTCDDVVVMYAGKVVEKAPVQALFARPSHPYTVGLLKSVPAYGSAGEEKVRLSAIPGVVPSLDRLPSGCRFRDRCDRATEECAGQIPPLVELRSGHFAACYHPVNA